MSNLYIFIDPDDQFVGMIEIQSFDVDSLCDQLRCDATDSMELFDGLEALVDGEGAWQGRQTEWELDGNAFWGPMLIFRGFDETGFPNPCKEEDIEKFYELIYFFDA